MKKKLHVLTAAALSILALSLAGCIVTGTFITDILIEDLDFVAGENLYRHQVSLLDDETWDEHKDDIKSIDLVGFELWIQNENPTDETFEGYVDAVDQPFYSTAAQVRTNAIRVLSEVTLAPGQNYISYPKSFGYIENLDKLKALVETGELNAYGLTTGGAFSLDSMRVIVTFTAGQ